MKRQIVQTKDKSTTLFVPELDEHYHSIHGAVQEAQHVFIKAGLELFIDHNAAINVLEVGFGTGLNSLLTQLWANQNQKSISYIGLEKYPVSLEEAEVMNYAELLGTEQADELLRLQHQAEWEENVQLSPYFSLDKRQIDFKDFADKNSCDLIYFDAFAPSAQANLWTVGIFKAMFEALKTEGTLVTYCVKGEVRRNMKAAGFEVEKLPGPPGKREMARAHKK